MAPALRSTELMGKKPHTWPEAKKLCRLNQHDITMAKKLGFGPDALIRNRPDPKQKWKLPVKYWVRELYEQRFGHVLGEKPVLPARESVQYDAEAARRFEEELYWEDYWHRNADNARPDGSPKTANKSAGQPEISAPEGITDDDLPF